MFRNKRNIPLSGEMYKLGTIKYLSEKYGIVKLLTNDIPYPNSPVLINKKEIGKVHDVFGQTSDVHLCLKFNDNVDGDKLVKDCTILEGHKEKFIPRNRFKSREEVENQKIKSKAAAPSSANKSKSFNKKDGNFKNQKFNNKNQSRGGRGGSSSNNENKNYNRNAAKSVGNTKKFENKNQSQSRERGGNKFNNNKTQRTKK